MSDLRFETEPKPRVVGLEEAIRELTEELQASGLHSYSQRFASIWSACFTTIGDFLDTLDGFIIVTLREEEQHPQGLSDSHRAKNGPHAATWSPG